MPEPIGYYTGVYTDAFLGGPVPAGACYLNEGGGDFDPVWLRADLFHREGYNVLGVYAHECAHRINHSFGAKGDHNTVFAAIYAFLLLRLPESLGINITKSLRYYDVHEVVPAETKYRFANKSDLFVKSRKLALKTAIEWAIDANGREEIGTAIDAARYFAELQKQLIEETEARREWWGRFYDAMAVTTVIAICIYLLF